MGKGILNSVILESLSYLHNIPIESLQIWKECACSN